jgi:Tfp pilus assembly PilM family ATPase
VLVSAGDRELEMAKRGKGSQVQGWAGVPYGKAVLLEVSSDWIKLIEVSGARGEVTLVRSHLEPVTHDTHVSVSLRNALVNGKFSHLPVISCIPRQLVNVRLLELPSTEPAEIRDMVELQVGRQTPYSLNEILSGYKMMGAIREATYTRVMLAIVQRSIVRERFYAIESAGYAVGRMSISSEGVLNWFLYHTRGDAPERVSALLDVDSFFTHMIVIQHRKVIYTKSILWGAKQTGEGLDVFVQRVKEAFQSCQESLRGTAVESLTVSGAGVRLEGVEEVLGTALSLPCKKADCLADLRPGREREALRDDLYATASVTALVGMALAPNLLDFDFEPDVVRMREQIRTQARRWSVAAGFLMTAMVSASLYGMLAAGYRFDALGTIKSQADGLQNRVVRVERMLEVIRATQERLDSRFLPEHLLPVIHRSIPEGVYLDTLDLDIGRSRFTIGGVAPQRRDIRELIRMLEESPYFTGVEEGGRTAMDRNERVTFQVVGRFKEEQPR